MKLKRDVSILFLVLIWLASGSRAAAQTSTKLAQTVIQGIVLGADGKPVPAASVNCQSSAGIRPRIVHTDKR